jgi:hypothetical protein
MKKPILIALIIAICLVLVYILSFFAPSKQIFVRIIGGIFPTQGYTMVYSFNGGSAQSAKCTQFSKGLLTEPDAIIISNPQNLELVGNATLRIYLLVTCENAVDRNWKIKVNNYIIYESKGCFGEWNYLDLSFPSSYLHQQNNEVSLECNSTSSGYYYINMGKTSEGNKEFFKTTYTISE